MTTITEGDSSSCIGVDHGAATVDGVEASADGDHRQTRGAEDLGEVEVVAAGAAAVEAVAAELFKIQKSTHVKITLYGIQKSYL